MYAVGFRLLGRFAGVKWYALRKNVQTLSVLFVHLPFVIISHHDFFTAEIISIVMAVVLIVTLVCLIVTCVKLKRTTSEGYKTFVNS